PGAPTPAGGPGAVVAGWSIWILTRSMSLTPLPWKRSAYPAPPAPPAAGLLTVTRTWADVVWFVAASRATAVRVYAPFATVVVFHEVAYGGTVYSGPRATPVSRNCTPTTPTCSEARAETLTLPAT